jgi:hypothetical protein
VSHRLLALALVFGALALGPGCKRGESVTVRKLLVDIEPGAAGPGGVLSREIVRELVTSALEADRGVELALGGSAGDVLRVRVESAALAPSIAGHEKGRGTLSLSVELSGKDAPNARRHRYSGSSVASAAGTVDFRALVRQAFGEAFAHVVMARGASEQSTETLLTWLEDGNLEARSRRLQAIRVLGSRREAKAVSSLVQALKADDHEITQAALGALTLIGDPTAAASVIEYAEKKPARIRKQAIEAARVMGGRLSAAWLFTLSTGHPDDDVQAAAAAALAQLETREPPREVARVEDPPSSAQN